jgi:hypothetical protein
MMMKFEEWIAVQQSRDDFIGEFARILATQDREPTVSKRRSNVDEHRIWADIVTRMPPPGYVDAFNHAWQEFLLARQKAKVSAAGEAGRTAV